MKPKRNEIEIALSYHNLMMNLHVGYIVGNYSFERQDQLCKKLYNAMSAEMARAMLDRNRRAFNLGFETCQAADRGIERLGKEAGNE